VSYPHEPRATIAPPRQLGRNLFNAN